jgi:TPP-dependent pyruvate/acetoin dehydrogenase alpha subunit
LAEFGILSEERANEIEAEIKKEVAEAFAWADRQPVPRAEDGVTNVFRGGPKVLPRQLANCPLWV